MSIVLSHWQLSHGVCWPTVITDEYRQFCHIFQRSLLCAMCFDVCYGQHTLRCERVPLCPTHIPYVNNMLHIGSLHDKLEPSFQDLYRKKLLTLSGKIMSDPSHILYEKYYFLPSNRRLRVARFNILRSLNLLCISL